MHKFAFIQLIFFVHLGASFIFYNCARIATLLKEFEKRVKKKEYPVLPDIGNVDFTTLNQPVSKNFQLINYRPYFRIV